MYVRMDKYTYVHTNKSFCVSHFPCRPHSGVPNGVLASQPDPPPHDGRSSKVPLDVVLLPELCHSPPSGWHLLLPQLGHQPLPLQPVFQAVPSGLRPGAAVSPDHRTRQHAQCEELPCFFHTLAAAAANKDSASQQGHAAKEHPNLFDLSGDAGDWLRSGFPQQEWINCQSNRHVSWIWSVMWCTF